MTPEELLSYALALTSERDDMAARLERATAVIAEAEERKPRIAAELSRIADMENTISRLTAERDAANFALGEARAVIGGLASKIPEEAGEPKAIVEERLAKAVAEEQEVQDKLAAIRKRRKDLEAKAARK